MKENPLGIVIGALILIGSMCMIYVVSSAVESSGYGLERFERSHAQGATANAVERLQRDLPSRVTRQTFAIRGIYFTQPAHDDVEVPRWPQDVAWGDPRAIVGPFHRLIAGAAPRRVVGRVAIVAAG